MKSYKNLEELFELAQQQQTLIEPKKVQEIIRLGKIKSQKRKLSKTMKIILFSSILSLGIGFNHYISTQEKIALSVSNEVAQVVNYNDENRELEQKKVLFNSEIDSKVDLKVIEKNRINKTTLLNHDSSSNKGIEQTEVRDSMVELLIPKTINPPTITKSIPEIQFSKANCIVLDKKELAEIGIYEKDGIFMFEQNKTPWGKVRANLLKDRSFTYSSTRQGLNKGDNPLPLFANSIEGNILFTLYVHADKDISIENLQSKAELSLPIWVDVEGSSYKSLIVWFKNDEKTKNLLPEKIRNILSEDPNYYSKNVSLYYSQTKDYKDTARVEVIANTHFDTSQIVDPSARLIKLLGIKNENGIRFKRKTGTCVMKIKMNDSEQLIDVTFCRKQTESKDIAKIVPSHITLKNSYGNISYNTFRKESMNVNDKTSLINEQENLIAIRVQKQNSKQSEILFWYQYTNAIANELDPNVREKLEEVLSVKKDLKVKGIEINTQKENSISYAEIAFSESNIRAELKTMDLSIAELKKLGVEIKDKEIYYSIPTINNNKFSLNELILSKYGTEILVKEIQEKPDTSSFILPILVTDISGNYMRLSFNNHKEISKVNLTTLIPVKVLSGDDYTAEDKVKQRHQPDLIFWYEPSSKFLSLLESRKAKEISSDIEALICKQNNSGITDSQTDTCTTIKTMSCNYFESCENSLNHEIKGYKVYPNPTLKDIYIELMMIKPSTLHFYLFTMDGKLIYEQKNEQMRQGKQQVKLENDFISPGIYLLQILSENGDKIVERIVVGE
jgi:hypothetical protein